MRVDPSSAANIMSPMMDLPSTSWSPLRTVTFDLNLFVACTKSAAGRACNPRRFLTRKSFCITPPPPTSGSCDVCPEAVGSRPMDPQHRHRYGYPAHEIKNNKGG